MIVRKAGVYLSLKLYRSGCAGFRHILRPKIQGAHLVLSVFFDRGCNAYFKKLDYSFELRIQICERHIGFIVNLTDPKFLHIGGDGKTEFFFKPTCQFHEKLVDSSVEEV